MIRSAKEKFCRGDWENENKTEFYTTMYKWLFSTAQLPVALYIEGDCAYSLIVAEYTQARGPEDTSAHVLQHLIHTASYLLLHHYYWEL
jgi:hypothetical protein